MKLKTFDSAGRLLTELEVGAVESGKAYAEADEMCVAYVVVDVNGVELASAIWLYDEETETGVWLDDKKLADELELDFTIDEVE